MQRPNLAGDLAGHIRELIAGGTLPPGERINETALSEALDVSRTPLREALSGLASEGFVRIRPRHGFFVASLGPDDVRELYEVRAVLDPAALEMAGLPDDSQLRRLRKLNLEIAAAAGDAEQIVDLDESWHLELLAHCPNGHVLKLIRQFMLRTRPLELAYMAGRGSGVDASVREHEEILDALVDGDLGRGVRLLRANMESAIPTLVGWAADRVASDDEREGEGGG